MNVGIVQACDDRELFGVGLYPVQRKILEAVEDPAKRVTVLCLGRRSGKTTMAALVLLWACLLRDDLDEFVRPGERRYAVGVAPNVRQARLLVAAAWSIVERSPVLAAMVEGQTEDEIRFRNGATLSAFPCTSRGSRGWPICALVMDEMAHFLSETEGPQVADRVWEALLPSTAQFGNAARIIASSTPYGMDNLFARLVDQTGSGELPDAQAFTFSTREANPTITDELLRAEQLRDPESFAAEYEAKLVGGGESYLDMGRVLVSDRGELPPSAISGAVLGLDPSFSRDPFGFAVVGCDASDPGRLLLAQAGSWRPERRKSFFQSRKVEDALLGKAAELARLYGARIVTDQYAAPAVVDRLRGEGLSVTVETMTASSKTAVFAELRAVLYSGRLELYEHPDLIGELRRLRSKFTAGAASVVNPRVGGSHGDIAQALALCAWAHRHGYGSAGEVHSGGRGFAAGLMSGWPGERVGQHPVNPNGQTGVRPGGRGIREMGF